MGDDHDHYFKKDVLLSVDAFKNDWWKIRKNIRY